ncbi:hypothetical protein NCC49_002068 [Naganishia albida]|nr:hypothetical protein NCC49_002068 [Naganishia albida]
MSEDPTSLAYAMKQIGWDTPLTETDAFDPLQSSNAFLVAFRWFVLSYLGPVGGKSLSWDQTTSLEAVFRKPFPSRRSEIDNTLEDFCGRFQAFCSEKAGQNLFGRPEFTVASSKIIGAYTAAMMNKCKTMNSQALHNFDYIFSGSHMRDAVLPIWGKAFLLRAAEELLGASTSMSDGDKTTVEDIASKWKIPLTERALPSIASGDGTTKGGVSSDNRSEGVGRTFTASSSQREPYPREWMNVFCDKLRQVDSLMSSSAGADVGTDNAFVPPLDDAGVSMQELELAMQAFIDRDKEQAPSNASTK